MKILITGGAGFIGSVVIRYLIHNTEHDVLNVDKLTYAGNLGSLQMVAQHPRYQFSRTDIVDQTALMQLFSDFQPDAVMHLAAESHVDRSIKAAEEFIDTNIVGTYRLLEVARRYWQNLPSHKQETFRFHHVSTDEVYGDLADGQDLFNEDSPYQPSSPYAASKASADHLVLAWLRTYGLPVVISHCCNNYGPYQFPEKLIPLMISKALAGEPLPVYGHGQQIRDWLYVEDHVRALYLVLTQAKVGKRYNIGADQQVKNIDVVTKICTLLEEWVPNKPLGLKQYQDLIEFVEDRPGHDMRYAINANKLKQDLGWQPNEDFDSGLRKTVWWYVNNPQWVTKIKTGTYQN